MGPVALRPVRELGADGVLVNAVIGFIQESKAESAIAALAKMVTTQAVVLRGGRRMNLPSEELVPGDVVLLAAGLGISTEGKEEDTIRGLKMGAKGYVKKPFQASELHGLIEKITAGAAS